MGVKPDFPDTGDDDARPSFAIYRHGYSSRTGEYSPDALTRPPGARGSIDKLLESADDEVYQDVLKLVQRLTRRAS